MIDQLNNKLDIISIIKGSIIFIAMILNTSRTGVVMFLIVAAMMVIKRIVVDIRIKYYLIMSVGIIGAYYGFRHMLSVRSDLNGIIDSNGRLITYKDGINLWFSSL